MVTSLPSNLTMTQWWLLNIGLGCGGGWKGSGLWTELKFGEGEIECGNLDFIELQDNRR